MISDQVLATAFDNLSTRISEARKPYILTTEDKQTLINFGIAAASKEELDKIMPAKTKTSHVDHFKTLLNKRDISKTLRANLIAQLEEAISKPHDEQCKTTFLSTLAKVEANPKHPFYAFFNLAHLSSRLGLETNAEKPEDNFEKIPLIQFLKLLRTVSQNNAVSIVSILSTKVSGTCVAQALLRIPNFTVFGDQDTKSHQQKIFFAAETKFLELLTSLVEDNRNKDITLNINIASLLKIQNDTDVNPGEYLGKLLLASNDDTTALCEYLKLLSVLIENHHGKSVNEILSLRSGILRSTFLHAFVSLDRGIEARQRFNLLLTNLKNKFNKEQTVELLRLCQESRQMFYLFHKETQGRSVLELIKERNNVEDIYNLICLNILNSDELKNLIDQEEALVTYIMKLPDSPHKLFIFENIVNFNKTEPHLLNEFFWRTCSGAAERTRDDEPLKSFTSELIRLRKKYPAKAAELKEKYENSNRATL